MKIGLSFLVTQKSTKIIGETTGSCLVQGKKLTGQTEITPTASPVIRKRSNFRAVSLKLRIGLLAIRC